MAERSKARVCGRSLVGIASSNPAGWHACLSLESVACCKVEVSATSRTLVRRTVVCHCVWSTNLKNKAALARLGLLRQRKCCSESRHLLTVCGRRSQWAVYMYSVYSCITHRAVTQMTVSGGFLVKSRFTVVCFLSFGGVSRVWWILKVGRNSYHALLRSSFVKHYHSSSLPTLFSLQLACRLI